MYVECEGFFSVFFMLYKSVTFSVYAREHVYFDRTKCRERTVISGDLGEGGCPYLDAVHARHSHARSSSHENPNNKSTARWKCAFVPIKRRIKPPAPPHHPSPQYPTTMQILIEFIFRERARLGTANLLKFPSTIMINQKFRAQSATVLRAKSNLERTGGELFRRKWAPVSKFAHGLASDLLFCHRRKSDVKSTDSLSSFHCSVTVLGSAICYLLALLLCWLDSCAEIMNFNSAEDRFISVQIFVEFMCIFFIDIYCVISEVYFRLLFEHGGRISRQFVNEMTRKKIAPVKRTDFPTMINHSGLYRIVNELISFLK